MKIREGLTFDDVLLEPKLSNIAHRDEVDISTRLNTLSLKVPIISANMDSITGFNMAKEMAHLGGLGIIHRFQNLESICKTIENLKYYCLKDIAVSTSLSYTERDYKQLLDCGANILCLDIAHAHSSAVHIHIKHTINKCRSSYNFRLIVGNIATASAARMLIEDGTNILKVGIGPGSLCTTRIQTGCGVPQLTAIDDIVTLRDGIGYSPNQVGIIADGGIRNSGDIVKALAAGADAVMIGKLFAGTDEAEMPSTYRGMASRQAQLDWKLDNPKYIEGEAIEVPGKLGPVKNVVEKLIAGLRSGMSYTGSRNLEELRKNASWIRITNAGLAESHPHGKTS